MNCRQIPGATSKEKGTEFIGEKGSLFVWQGACE